MDIYNLIIKKTEKIDLKYKAKNNFDNFKINFIIPKTHPKHNIIRHYNLELGNISNFISKNKKYTYLVDLKLQNLKILKDLPKDNTYFLTASEYKLKQINFLNKFIINNSFSKNIVIVGGGIMINVGAYIAEKLNLKLYLFPTTVLSMADSSGGKVRVNHIIRNKFYKHYYKSYYEPDLMIIDKLFLDSLSNLQKKIGLVEIIKHALYQSDGLYDFLINYDVLKDNALLLKAILWTEELKQICLKENIDEKSNGSGKILRAGHNLSDKLEEESKFKLPHGLAVAKGITLELTSNKNYKLLRKAKFIFNKYNSNY